MLLSLRDRLQYGAAVLNSLEARRLRTGNPTLHQTVEHNIIARELEELAEEWKRKPNALQLERWSPVAMKKEPAIHYTETRTTALCGARCFPTRLLWLTDLKTKVTCQLCARVYFRRSLRPKSTRLTKSSTC